jgi:hypothetical protein
LLDPENFVSEFKALAERYTKDRLEFCGDWTESGIGKWGHLGTPSELLLAEFRDVATRAGIALGAPTGVSPDDYFLDCLFNKLREKHSSFASPAAVGGMEFGRIRQSCEAAATFWLWRKATTVAEEHNVTNQWVNEASSAAPDIDVTWGPYFNVGGGILLFRNNGTEAAQNVRLRCSTESGWRPNLRPQVIGPFLRADISEQSTQANTEQKKTKTDS